MTDLQALLDDCNALLHLPEFHDYCPNGLQVEGTQHIAHIVSGVTACAPLINSAIKLKADLLLVHHGFFWKNEPAPIVGMKQKRIKALLAHDINLVSYHLPLDAHPIVGNNAQLANKLDMQIEGYFGEHNLALWGVVAPISSTLFTQTLQRVLGRKPLHIGPAGTIQKVGICTGAAQNYIGAAAQIGLDAFISGEVSETTYHIAMEAPIQYFAAGHHATERYGVQALADYLAQKYHLTHTFVDIENPV